MSDKFDYEAALEAMHEAALDAKTRAARFGAPLSYWVNGKLKLVYPKLDETLPTQKSEEFVDSSSTRKTDPAQNR